MFMLSQVVIVLLLCYYCCCTGYGIRHALKLSEMFVTAVSAVFVTAVGAVLVTAVGAVLATAVGAMFVTAVSASLYCVTQEVNLNVVYKTVMFNPFTYTYGCESV
jgi:uncharacterized membrane protein